MWPLAKIAPVPSRAGSSGYPFGVVVPLSLIAFAVAAELETSIFSFDGIHDISEGSVTESRTLRVFRTAVLILIRIMFVRH